LSPDFPEFPRPRRARLWLRFLLAGFVVVVLTAGATATAGLLGVQSFVDDLKQGGTIRDVEQIITRADAGDPQTLLLIGSDHRARTAKLDRRSDTMMLVRLDPDANATTVLSIPRDLKVDFQTPSGGMRTGAKINETYTLGGEALTARVIKRLLGVEINHIINVNFRSFKAAVDAIGCVYIDVDHRYYHSNEGLPASAHYAEIDISAGYQRLCGEKALDFVRFRHADSDFVRAARQQEFLRQVKGQYGVDRFIANPHEVTSEVGKYVRTDAALQSKEELLKLANLAAYVAGKPVREVPFPVKYDSSLAYVLADESDFAQLRREFLSPGPTAPRARPTGRGGRGGRGRRGRRADPSADGLVDKSEQGRSYAIQLGGMRFPVYYPRLLTASGEYMPPIPGVPNQYPRAYRIKADDGKMKAAYRLVVSTGEDGNYYGVQGTTWLDPPILRNPSDDRRVVNGKELELFYDGDRLRVVAWRTPRAVYWISNTLQKRLTNRQMIGIAGSLTRLGAGD
jgi:LCP family protein required for cell wall assembly